MIDKPLPWNADEPIAVEHQFGIFRFSAIEKHWKIRSSRRFEVVYATKKL